MKLRHVMIVVQVLVMALFAANRLAAQNSYGTIVGTVQDSTGAVVVGASVAVRNSATGVVETVLTHSDGGYIAINLVPGPYVVSVKLAGFATTETSTLQLTTNQTLRADLQLRPGTAQTIVNVSASETLIDTDSSAVTSEISSTEVSDMPLETRNMVSLLALTAGTIDEPTTAFKSDQASTRTQLSGGAVFVSGSRSDGNEFLIDGVDDNDPGFQTPTITVPIDAIQDMRLMSDNYSAEYGGSAAQVNVATKSGTNKFHGTMYNFLENDFLDATDQSFGEPAIKPVLRYNQFGASIGGPVLLPKFNGKDKLFFFADYEGTRWNTTSTQFGFFPTAAELSGNFSADAPIYNPSTGQQFPGNQITTIDPVAAKVIALHLFVTPNIPLTSTGENAEAVLGAPDDIDEWNARVDYKISQRDSVFVRYSASTQGELTPNIATDRGSIDRQIGKNVGISYVRIISPNLVNELRIGLNRPISIAAGAGSGVTNIAGALFAGTSSTPATWTSPTFDFTGYNTIGGDQNSPLDYTTTSISVADNVTLMKGAHTLEFGAAGKHMFFKEINAFEPNGIIEFDGEYTAGPANPDGNAIADFLLGLSNNASVNQGNYTGWYNGIGYDFFGQDNWRVAKTLTLNLGLRYEYMAPFQEEHNRVSIFDPTYPGGRILTPDQSIVEQLDNPLVALAPSRYLFNPDRDCFSPRIGFSYRPFNRTVLHGGYGIFYDTTEFNEYIFPVLNPPFAKTYGAIGTLASPISMDNLFPIAPTPEPVAGSISLLTLNKNSRTPYVEQWNFGIERELPGNTVLELSYVGSSASKLDYRTWPSQGVLSNPGPDATVTHLYPNMDSILEDATGASSNYNAGRVRLQKQFSHGYSLAAFYTYSHTLGTMGAVYQIGAEQGYPQNAWDLRGNYSFLGFDTPQNFVLDGTWELPFGRGKAIGTNAPSAANLLLSGWQLNGMYNAQSGFPYPIAAPYDNSGTGSEAPRAEQVGNPKASIPAGLAFNPQAFAEPTPGTFGNSNPAVLRGKGINNADISIFKNTYVHESLNLQLRLETFNTFNHTQPGFFPNTTITSSGVGTYDTLAEQARTLQLAAKIIF